MEYETIVTPANKNITGIRIRIPFILLDIDILKIWQFRGQRQQTQSVTLDLLFGSSQSQLSYTQVANAFNWIVHSI